MLSRHKTLTNMVQVQNILGSHSNVHCIHKNVWLSSSSTLFILNKNRNSTLKTYILGTQIISAVLNDLNDFRPLYVSEKDD